MFFQRSSRRILVRGGTSTVTFSSTRCVFVSEYEYFSRNRFSTVCLTIEDLVIAGSNSFMVRRTFSCLMTYDCCHSFWILRLRLPGVFPCLLSSRRFSTPRNSSPIPRATILTTVQVVPSGGCQKSSHSATLAPCSRLFPMT